MSELSIGIDFGTTKTLVSFYNEVTGRPETIRLGRGRDYLPTSVYASVEGGFLFGEEADDHVEFGADRYCRAFKMKLGSKESALVFFEGARVIQYSARELTRSFLQYVRERSEEEVFMGKKVTRAVITKPVLFSPAQCEDLKQAAEEAGFSEVTFVTEPEAAGYAFCTLCPAEAFKGNALIIDWGGGTLDMALVSRNGNRITTYREYTAGDILMGGEVFDEKLWDHVVCAIKETDETDLSGERPEHQNLLLNKVRQAKEMLSTQSRITLRLSSAKGPCSPINLERADFERIIDSPVGKAAGIAKQLMNSIPGQSMRPELLLLVGGTSLIPAISTTLEQVTGLPCKKWQFSREAVSLGAALFARSSRSQPKESRFPGERKVSLHEKAEQGDSEAQYQLGDKYYNGADNVRQSYCEAVFWYAKSAERGNSWGQFKMGKCYQYGHGVEKSIERALEWFGKSAEQKNNWAQESLNELKEQRTNPLAQNEPSVVKKDETGEKSEQENPPLVYKVYLTTEEMENGCIKTLMIQNKRTPIEIPPFVKHGTELYYDDRKLRIFVELDKSREKEVISSSTRNEDEKEVCSKRKQENPSFKSRFSEDYKEGGVVSCKSSMDKSSNDVSKDKNNESNEIFASIIIVVLWVISIGIAIEILFSSQSSHMGTAFGLLFFIAPAISKWIWKTMVERK